MLYLLDANVLIIAERNYYGSDQVPEFWDWLLYKASENRVKIPREILTEVLAGTNNDDPLLKWIKRGNNQKILTLDEEVDQALLQTVVYKGYELKNIDDQFDQVGYDPFLIAYAMVDPDRCVVTNEVSKPSRKAQNRKIPDVCGDFSVKCCNPFEFARNLGFRTSWRNDLLD